MDTRSPVRMGMAVSSIVRAAETYCRSYKSLIGSDIADDGVLGPAFCNILLGVETLLNGELGTYDGGTIWDSLDRIAKLAGYANLDECREDV